MQLVVSTYTTTWSYWLNWRVLLSVTWVLASMVIASFMIWKYEGLGHPKLDRGETQHGKPQFLYYDEAWRPCIKEIHPIWLLAFRVIAFCFLLATLIVNVLVNGGGIFFYHTQWTFALFTIYFGLGSLLSLYGCYQYHKISRGFDVHHAVIDTEQGLYLPPPCGETTNMFRMRKISDHQEEKYVLHTSGIWGYVFQVIFLVSGGAVMLTDCVYWLAIFLFLTTKDYNLNFMTVNMHTLNAIVLIGDAALNCLQVIANLLHNYGGSCKRGDTSYKGTE
ncbi:hypothetical protein L1049_003231 [Liquidambar formosana]|uniref:Uncharacterized protein n=1 Tax=Liquidambar formosana TaxID=63359 RepID=A0AAP0NH39_LIQFO